MTYVPLGPVREHIHTLTGAGHTYEAIARATGISRQGVRYVAETAGQWCEQWTAQRVLAVTPARILAATPPHGHVTAVGALRRANALLAIGWTFADMTAHGSPHARGLKQREWVTRTAHDRMAATYNQLWDKPGPSVRAKDRARKAGYAPPMAWDDDTIDDPTATPHPWDATKTNGVNKRYRPTADLAEDVEFVLTIDPWATHRDLADRFGYPNADAIQHALTRAGRRDLLAHLARNTRAQAGHDITQATA